MNNASWTERREARPARAGAWGDRRLDQSMKTGSWGVNDRGTRVTDDTIASVLLVVDDSTTRLALKVVLEPLGLPIVEADSGQRALRLLMEQDFAVILLDVRMP